MKLLKHLATFGGIYLLGVAFYLSIFWATPIALVDKNGEGVPWFEICIIHSGALFVAWATYGSIKLDD